MVLRRRCLQLALCDPARLDPGAATGGSRPSFIRARVVPVNQAQPFDDFDVEVTYDKPFMEPSGRKLAPESRVARPLAAQRRGLRFMTGHDMTAIRDPCVPVESLVECPP
jgi:hypothetical protein